MGGYVRTDYVNNQTAQTHTCLRTGGNHQAEMSNLRQVVLKSEPDVERSYKQTTRDKKRGLGSEYKKVYETHRVYRICRFRGEEQ